VNALLREHGITPHPAVDAQALREQRRTELLDRRTNAQLRKGFTFCGEPDDGELTILALKLRDILLGALTDFIYTILFESGVRARRCREKIERKLRRLKDASGVDQLPADLFSPRRLRAIFDPDGRDPQWSGVAGEPENSTPTPIDELIAGLLTRGLVAVTAKQEGSTGRQRREWFHVGLPVCCHVVRRPDRKDNNGAICEGCRQQIARGSALVVPLDFGLNSSD
jgi:hypothetical protein